MNIPQEVVTILIGFIFGSAFGLFIKMRFDKQFEKQENQ